MDSLQAPLPPRSCADPASWPQGYSDWPEGHFDPHLLTPHSPDPLTFSPLPASPRLPFVERGVSRRRSGTIIRKPHRTNNLRLEVFIPPNIRMGRTEGAAQTPI